MHFSPVIFTALTLLSSCTLTTLAAPTDVANATEATEDLGTSPVDEGPLAKDDVKKAEQRGAGATTMARSTVMIGDAESTVDVLGVFEKVVSANASKYWFSVTVVCSKGMMKFRGL
ncbi:hypothetical protein TSTA_086160 [Talaromyces stipitatus ATCC 10500]|uniref:Uncharacterized protein n=1 Tax=Talaromyces stipitatus (strain ATCC 10500 / CBS 375.48 / QM 6759 / NRRL 1006) TaxID=441959 RepID=B8M207_TALSN|nr:uncharacterized protein TSTA_086160 [Talaromyces stipitatus ATCC 10500]EED21385.1 hypothetical protein TSTA_086160 [Talaromyces stipitatus ATCC 10500]